VEFFSVGNRLREIRLNKGLSQEQVAHIADVTPAYFGQVERGAKNVTVFTLEKICNALNISLAEFFNPANKDNTEIDNISMQIINQLTYKSDFEKQKILKLVKLVFSIQDTNQ
jgi:transcriptional regulator with XRE-family HTH domain